MRHGPTVFSQALKEAQQCVRDQADAALPADGRDLSDAMRYAVLGGKALRAFLVLESSKLHCVSRSAAAPVAFAIECIHGYSLVHDDLPCMDDDDLRRGQPTVHRAWNEAVAVLAGDALQALAFGQLCLPGVGSGEISRRLISGLAEASGHLGMVGGQMLDIEAETKTAHSLKDIEAIQSGKTGALFSWSAGAGAVLAGADHGPLARYGAALGRAFQIVDDILDVEGDVATLGKAVGKDERAGKATFVTYLGLDGAKRRAFELVEEASDVLSVYKEKAETLKDAARFVIDRVH